MRSLFFTTSLLLLIGIWRSAVAFAPEGAIFRGVRRSALTPLFAKKPVFDKKTEKWVKANDDSGEYPYDAFGALLRHGPSPFIVRLTSADEYEQGILKYMAITGVTRAEATGNMDAKMSNPADWQFQKTAEKNGAPKVDYTELKKKDAALVLIWAFFITPLGISVIQQTISQF